MNITNRELKLSAQKEAELWTVAENDAQKQGDIMVWAVINEQTDELGVPARSFWMVLHPSRRYVSFIHQWPFGRGNAVHFP